MLPKLWRQRPEFTAAAGFKNKLYISRFTSGSQNLHKRNLTGKAPVNNKIQRSHDRGKTCQAHPFDKLMLHLKMIS